MRQNRDDLSFRRLAGPTSLNFLGSLCRLLLSVLLARTLGVEGRGEIAVFVTAAELVSRAIAFGFPIALGSRAYERTKPLVSQVLTCLVIIWVLISVPISFLFYKLLDFETENYIIISGVLLLTSFCGRSVARKILAGSRKVLLAILIQLVSILFTLTFVMLLSFYGFLTVELTLCAYAFGGTLGFLSGVFFIGRYSFLEKVWPPLLPTKKDWLLGLRSLPFTTLQFFNSSGYIIAIGYFGGFAVAGLFAVALNVVRPLLLIAMTVSVIGYSDGVRGDEEQNYAWLSVRALLISILWIPVAWIAIPIAFGEDFRDAQVVSVLLCLSAAVQILYKYVSQASLARGNIGNPTRAEMLATTIIAVGLCMLNFSTGVTASSAAMILLIAALVKIYFIRR